MAIQWFTINHVKPGKVIKDSYVTYQSYALALHGVGNPVRFLIKEPVVREPQKGDRIYGQLIEEKGPDSRIFYNFEEKPVPADYLRQQDIHAQVGLKEAIRNWREATYESDEERNKAYDHIKTEAIHFARLIEEIKEEL